METFPEAPIAPIDPPIAVYTLSFLGIAIFLHMIKFKLP